MGAKIEKLIEADGTILCGMKTVMADCEDRGKVMYIPDIVYAQRPEETLKLQLLLPDGLMPGDSCGRTYPLVVYVQGAAWGEQETYHNLPQLCALAKKGYVIASVKHRAAEKAKFPAFLQDVKSAIRFLRANAGRYFIDPSQVAVWGDSSGGHAALMTGVTGDMDIFKTDDHREISDAVKAVVDFYGPTDLSKINCAPRNPEYLAARLNTPEDILFGGPVEEDPSLSEPGNPLNYVSKETPLPPFLIVHGDSDATVPFNQSVLMVKKLQECGKTVEFYKVCGGEHGYFIWTDEMIDIVDKFLKAYLNH